jgi:hypothetical protein
MAGAADLNANRAPRPPIIDPPAEPEPRSLPAEPDEGTVPTGIPEDPERDRMVDPGLSSTYPLQKARK